MPTNFAHENVTLLGVTAENVGAFMSAVSDIGLLLDQDDKILQVTISDEKILDTVHEWYGRPITDVLTVESLPKMTELLESIRAGRTSRRRQVNHPIPDSDDMPVAYGAWLLDGEGQVVLCGQDLRPMARLQARLVASQQSLERDYEKMRKTEARYRLLFQNVTDAFLVVDALDGRVVEANPKAGDLFGCQPSELAGRKMTQHFDRADRTSIEALLAGVLASARSESLAVNAPGVRSDLELNVQLFRAATATLFMVRVIELDDDAVADGPPTDDNMIKLLESSMDGVALVDEAGNILWTNEAFLDLTQLVRLEHAQGASLGDFLGRTELDFSVLLSNTRQHGRLRSFSTTCRGASGLTTDVEISAVAMPNGTPPGFGFVIRDVSLRSAGDTAASDGLPRSAEQLTELIGRMPLRDVVRTATDVIEKMCIQTALRMTGDNRASAAEMLGLSRQSLYVKLRRYDLGDPKES